MSKLVKKDFAQAKMFHGTFQIIDDLYAPYEGGEFGKSYKVIYSLELELKFDHSGSHATFLELGITISQLSCIINMTAFLFPLHLC